MAYNDDYMTFDTSSMRYILTPKDITEKLGIDLTGEINERQGINPTVIVNNFLNRVSALIYGYIHKFSNETYMQDYKIAMIDELRAIIKNAMEYQFVYMKMKGDFSLSAEKEKREIYIDELAKEELNKTVNELGTSILYSGGTKKWTLPTY